MPTHLLIVSHACVIKTNQQIYAELQKKTGWKLTIVVPSNWQNEYQSNIKAAKWDGMEADLIEIPVTRPGNIVLHAYSSELGRVIKRANPDVIYIHNEPYAVSSSQVQFFNWRHRDVPIGTYSAQNILKKTPFPFSWAEKAMMKKMKFAFPISVAVQQVLQQKGYRGACPIVPLGIDTEIYRPIEDSQVRAEIGAGGSEVILGYLGRLVPEKGLKTMFEALSRLQDRSWKVVMVGAGPMQEELVELSTQLGIQNRVQWVGFVPHTEAPKYIAAFDTFILPSETQPNWKEQFGRVIIESMACGTPVLGSDSGEIPNLITATGGGLIFRERDVADLTDKLRQLIDNSSLREEKAAIGRQSVEDKYSIRVAVDIMEKTIRGALSGNSS